MLIAMAKGIALKLKFFKKFKCKADDNDDNIMIQPEQSTFVT
jgi:hypothetical protein